MSDEKALGNNEFHVMQYFERRPQKHVPPKPQKLAHDCDQKTLLANIPLAFKKPSMLVKSAFHLMLKENCYGVETIRGSPFHEEYGHNQRMAAFWTSMDFFVLRNDHNISTKEYRKGQKVTCLTIYPELIGMIASFRGSVDIGAYFPIDGTTFSNTSDQKYLEMQSCRSNKKVRRPMFDEKTQERFLNIPLQNAIIMTFSCHDLPSYDTSLVGTMTDRFSIETDADDTIFTRKIRRYKKWQNMKTKEEIFDALKLDLYRGNRFPSPTSPGYMCSTVYCECIKFWRVLLDHGFIPIATNYQQWRLHCYREDNLLMLAPSLDVFVDSKLEFESCKPSDKTKNDLLSDAIHLVEGLRKDKMTAFVDLIDNMHIVVVKQLPLVTLAETISKFYDKKGYVMPRHYCPVAAMCVPYLYTEMVKRGGEDSVQSRAKLADAIDRYCSDRFMLDYNSFVYIVEVLGWLHVEEYVGIFLDSYMGHSTVYITDSYRLIVKKNGQEKIYKIDPLTVELIKKDGGLTRAQ